MEEVFTIANSKDVQVNFLVRRKFGGTLVRTTLIDGHRITSYVTERDRDRCLSSALTMWLL